MAGSGPGADDEEFRSARERAFDARRELAEGLRKSEPVPRSPRDDDRGARLSPSPPLAVVGGLTSSTVLSLFLVPVMFLFFAKRVPAEEESS